MRGIACFARLTRASTHTSSADRRKKARITCPAALWWSSPLNVSLPRVAEFQLMNSPMSVPTRPAEATSGISAW